MALTKTKINLGTEGNLSGSRSLLGTENTLVSSSAQLATSISGSFTAASSSFSTRVAQNEASASSLKGTGTIQGVGTTNAVTFATVDTGQGANELYDMNQNVKTDSAVTFATVDTGQGANELYDMDQNVKTDSAVTFVTVDTGQGANELYDMDQNVLTTSSPTFVDLTATGTVTAQEFHTEFVSASIVYTSGSNKFGNSSDDIHQFTGSVHLTDSGSVSGSIFSTGSFGSVVAGGTGVSTFTGNVGIGTTSPGVELEIVGSVSASVSGSFGVLKTGDLELENERGHWKIIEESEYLSIYNVNTNKKYKFVLEEIE